MAKINECINGGKMKEKSREVLEFLKGVFAQFENNENMLLTSNQQLLVSGGSQSVPLVGTSK